MLHVRFWRGEADQGDEMTPEKDTEKKLKKRIGILGEKQINTICLSSLEEDGFEAIELDTTYSMGWFDGMLPDDLWMLLCTLVTNTCYALDEKRLH